MEHSGIHVDIWRSSKVVNVVGSLDFETDGAQGNRSKATRGVADCVLFSFPHTTFGSVMPEARDCGAVL